MKKRLDTKKIFVGNVQIGGNNNVFLNGNQSKSINNKISCNHENNANKQNCEHC